MDLWDCFWAVFGLWVLFGLGFLFFFFFFFFFFHFLVMNLWVSHWMVFNGFLEFDFDEGWIRVKNLSGLEKLCNLWSLAEVLVDVDKDFVVVAVVFVQFVVFGFQFWDHKSRLVFLFKILLDLNSCEFWFLFLFWFFLFS